MIYLCTECKQFYTTKGGVKNCTHGANAPALVARSKEPTKPKAKPRKTKEG